MCTATVHRPTVYSYRRRGCRCPDTIAVYREYERAKYRRRSRTADIRARRMHSGIVDEIAVERACRGEVLELTFEERAEVVRVLTERGLAASAISQRLGVSERTVLRYRRRIHSLGISPVDKVDVSRSLPSGESDGGVAA